MKNYNLRHAVVDIFVMIVVTVLVLFVITTAAFSAEYGIASYYNTKPYSAAHKTLPKGSQVLVTNLDNNKSIRVVINDRGPYIRGRIIDVSKHAASVLDFRNKGIVKVKIEVIR